MRRRDPREEFARKVIAACAGAKTIVAYNAPFEKKCIKSLADAFPQLNSDLTALSKRIKDLLPIVRDHVYHPDFGGSFSIKSVLPALVPGLGYDDLEIWGGSAASTALEMLLFGAVGAQWELRCPLARRDQRFARAFGLGRHTSARSNALRRDP